MTISKELIILAISVKHSDFCVAGREVTKRGKKKSLGDWVRPVSSSEGGALSRSHITYADSAMPQILDVVEVSLGEVVGSQEQPENWLIAEGQWKKTASLNSKGLALVVETPDSLWDQDGCTTDKISAEAFIAQGHTSSLSIIEPTSFSMKIWTEYNQFKGHNQKKRRAIFDYNSKHYDLAITDPNIDEKYFSAFPNVDEPAREIHLEGAGCLLCISLAGSFNGYRYKLVATIIEKT